MVIIQNMGYSHPNTDTLFTAMNFTVEASEKMALIGDNGTGKSTLLKLIAGILTPASGQITTGTPAYVVPQVFGQYDHLTVAEALGIAPKLKVLQEILAGNATEQNFELLNDDWTLEERCQAALAYWQLNHVLLEQRMQELSGGEKTKVFLAGIQIYEAALVLLDEPSNHLDAAGRVLLYDFIKTTKATVITVSHDRKLLQLFHLIGELNNAGIKLYGGNYDFYLEQRDIEREALQQDIHAKERALKKAKEKERETLMRQQKLDARGKGKQEKSGVARIMMNTLKNNAEKSTAKLRSAHAEKIAGMCTSLQALRASVNENEHIRFGFQDTNLHQGKVLVTATHLNHTYEDSFLWKEALNFEIRSGDRMVIKGANGSGKTTLIKLILGKLLPTSGVLTKTTEEQVYIDQAYALIDNELTVLQQATTFNTIQPEEHVIKNQLIRFLFDKDSWARPCHTLSGGERLKLLLCCMTLADTAPDMIILDEPTNNLDIQNIEILTAAVNEYQGTLVVVSHDATFLDQIGITTSISL